MGVSQPLNGAQFYTTIIGWAGSHEDLQKRKGSLPGGWSGFVEGEVVVMKLDPLDRTLAMYVPRLQWTFALELPLQPTWVVYVHLGHGDGVEVLPALEDDMRLLW